MGRYIAFDVETPNRYNNRMSAIGITVLEDGRITESFFSYVDPEQPFDRFNTELTGISSETVKDAPNFAKLWPEIEPYLSSGVLVAHNASFDMGVLRKCLCDYGIYWKPVVQGLCTVIMGRRLLPGIGHRLNELCYFYGIRLDHHQADSDSRACAEILQRYLEDGADPSDYVKRYVMTPPDESKKLRAEALKAAYGLQKHPEGGWFSEVYTAPFAKDGRALMGSIYFLLEGREVSHFHRIDCDELWYHHEGGPLRVTVLHASKCETLLLGGKLEQGQRGMAVIPAGAIFAAECLEPDGYAFLSCATTPAFRYEGFRLLTQAEIAQTPGATPELLRLAYETIPEETL